jgi:hypothetical protein
MKPKDINHLLIALSLVVVPIIVFIFIYNITLNKAKNEWYQQEYVDKNINGTVQSITEFEGNPFVIVLSLKDVDEIFNLSYGTICVDKEFRDFVAPGDSASKKAGEEVMVFYKSSNAVKTWKLHFCD